MLVFLVVFYLILVIKLIVLVLMGFENLKFLIKLKMVIIDLILILFIEFVMVRVM